jgi:hypothetical protein
MFGAQRAALAVAVALALAASGAQAQNPTLPTGAGGFGGVGGLGGLLPGVGAGAGQLGAGIGQVSPGQPLDTTTARLLGIPTAPARKFPQPDSVMSRLLGLSGYKVTQFIADSARLLPDERRLRLEGAALAQQQSVTLEADTIAYQQQSCTLDASGGPHLFDKSQVLVGGGIAYNTCTKRGIIKGALTNFSTGQAAWFLRGNVAADSSSKRIYAASSEITSCDLPTPHYHFAAKQVKWVSNSVFVARSIVLYVRDVPILWLPFMFQETKPGRRSGVLIPQFGFSDIVRPSRSYQRQVTNIGYYWATNDYMDLTARLDWFASRYVQVGVSGQYNVLDRFLRGSAEISRQFQAGGASATNFRWGHQQQFDLSTSLNFDVSYVSNSFVVRNNALDPLRNTQQVNSSVRLTKRYAWGLVDLGGTRRQSLSDNSSSTTLPALTITPKPIDISRSVTWSPGFTFNNALEGSTPQPNLLVARPDGRVDTIPQVGSTRTTSVNLATPLRIGGFNWTNQLTYIDRAATQRQALTFAAPDPTAPPGSLDSVTISRFFPGDFATTIDWQTGINLPVLFQRTWRIVPSLGISNKTGQPFAVRNRNTAGAWVLQGKKFNFNLSSSPTLFAFLPGIGPLQRIRHSFAPQITFSYSPATSISEEFARAVTTPGTTPVLAVPATQTLSVGMLNTLEGKTKPQPGDTLGTTARKVRILSINTSAVSYDFEQAKQPGLHGWNTAQITNSFLTDLIPGFNLSLTHSLWRGDFRSDTAHFSPFLTNLQTNFTLTGNTFRAIGSIFGLGRRERGAERRNPNETQPVGLNDAQGQRPSSTFFSANQVPLGQRPFAIQVSYSVSRTRPVGDAVAPPSRKNLNFNTGFSPTRFWSLAWSAQYDVTNKTFESNSIALERDLHEWRLSLRYVRNANSNSALFFSVFLIDLPELKFDYNQATFER